MTAELLALIFAGALLGFCLGIGFERRRRSKLVRLSYPEIRALADNARDISDRLVGLEYAGRRALRLSEVTGLLYEFADLLEARPGWKPRATRVALRRAAEAGAVSDCGRENLWGLVRRVCAKRGWSLHWTHRSAYLHLEAAELAEAVRGKRGDTLDESADVLITLLALSPHDLDEITDAARAKLTRLLSEPRYPGEEHDELRPEL